MLQFSQFYNKQKTQQYIISIIKSMQQQNYLNRPKSLTYVIEILSKNDRIQCTNSGMPTKQKLNEAIEQLRRINAIFNRLNLQKQVQEDQIEMGELSDIIKFSKQVSGDLNIYCKKYLNNLKAGKKINYKSNFWGKVRDIIIDAKQKSQQKTSVSDFLIMLINQLIKSQTAKAQNSEKLCYKNQKDEYTFVEQQLKRYGINQQKIRQIAEQFKNLEKVEETILKVIGASKEKNMQISKRFEVIIKKLVNRQDQIIQQNTKLKTDFFSLHQQLEKISDSKSYLTQYSEDMNQKSQDYIKKIEQKISKLSNSTGDKILQKNNTIKNQFQKIASGLAKILGSTCIYREKQEEMISQCHSYIQKMKETVQFLRNNELNEVKINALKHAQNILKSGKRLQKYGEYHDYYQQILPIQKVAEILKPIIDDYDIINGVHNKLGTIVEEDRNKQGFNSTSIAQRCLGLSCKIDWEIKQTFKLLDQKFNQGDIYSITGLFGLMNSWKSSLQAKITSIKTEAITPKTCQPQRVKKSYNRSLNNNLFGYTKIQEQKKQIDKRNNKLKEDAQAQYLTKNIHQIRSNLKLEIFKQIEEAKILEWKDFRKKYERKQPPSGKDIQIKKQIPFSVTDQIIWKVFTCTRVPLQLTQDKSIFQILQSGKQKQDIIQKLKSEISQLQKIYNELEEQKNWYIQQYSSQKQLKQKQIKENRDIYQNLTKITQEYQKKFKQMKQQSRNIQDIHEHKLKLKQTEIQRFNKLSTKLITQKNQAAQKIVGLEAQVQRLLEQQLRKQNQKSSITTNQNQTSYNKILQLKGKIVQLEREINECIEYSKKILKKKLNFGTLKQICQLLADEIKQWKQLYEQTKAARKQCLENIMKIMKDGNIQDYADVENKVEYLFKQKIQLESSFKKQTLKNQLILSKLSQLFPNNEDQSRKQQNKKIKQQPKNSEQLQKQILHKIENALQQKNSNQKLHIRDSTKMFKNQEDELYVLTSLQKYLEKKKIAGFNLLYRSSQGGNLKAAVQKKANTLLIIKTKAGHSISCYSSRSYCGTRDYQQPKGVLVSIFSSASYRLRSYCYPTTPSDEFLIFGQQAIKLSLTVADNLKMLIKLDSNSGFQYIINGTRHTEYNICGENGNEVEIEGFEIYQVQFQGKDQQIIEIKPNVISSNTKRDTTNQATQIIRPSIIQAQKKSETVVLPGQSEGSRNLSSNKALQNQLKDMKQKKQKYEKSIKTLQTQNQKLLEVIRKYEPNYNLEGKTKVSPPKKQNLNKAVTVKSTPNTNLNKNIDNSISSGYCITDQTLKQIDNMKSSLAQKQRQLEQAIKRRQIAEQQTKANLQKLNLTEANLVTVQKALETFNIKLQKNKQAIQQKLQEKGQQLAQISSKQQDFKEHISRANSVKNRDQKLIAQVQEIEKALDEERRQKNEIRTQKDQLFKQFELANQHIKQLEQQKAKTSRESIQSSQKEELALTSKQKNVKQCQNEKQQILKPMIADTEVQTQQTQVQNNQKVEQFTTTETPAPLTQIKQAQQQKTVEKNPREIVAELLTDIVKKVEENQVKRIEELLSSAKQTKQIYQKLKKKKIQITATIQTKEKQIIDLERTIQQKMLERSNIQYEISQMSQKTEQIKIIQKQIDQLTNQKSTIKQDIQKEREEFNRYQKEQKEASSRQIEKEKQELIKIKKQSKQTLDKQQKQLAKIKEELTKNRADVEKAKKSIAQFLSKRNQIQKQIIPKQKLLRELAEKQKKIMEKLKQAEEQIAKKNQEKQKINALLQEVEQRRKQLSGLNQKIKNQQLSLKNLQERYYDKQDEYDRINRKISSLSQSNKEYLELESKSKKITADYELKQKKLQELQAKIEQIQRNLKRQKNQAAELTKKSQEETEKARQNIQKYSRLEQQAREKLGQVEQQLYQKSKQKLKYGKYPNRFFIGQVLSNQIQRQLNREFIISLFIKMYPNRTITKTKLKFSYPLMKEINPHLIIDDIPHYIIIMKLANLDKIGQNYLLSMYSERPLTKYGETNKGKGFIASITNQKAFYLRNTTTNNPRVTQYNEFYIIFGNAQLRFRLGSESLETNIGHMYRSFDTQDHKTAEIFTGTNQLTATIDSYEIYQILFNNQL